VQDQPVVRVPAKRLRDDLLELRLDLVDRLAGRKTGAVAHPEHVRVDRKGFLSESSVEHNVCGFAPNSREGLQLFARAGNLAAVSGDQRFTQRDHVPCLGVEQADGLDCGAKPLLPELDHLLRRLDALEERAGREVDAGVGRLGGEDHRDEQSVRVVMLELGRRRRVRLGQAAEELENLVALHRLPITSRIE
jgi:hypothetical protein